MIPCRDIRWWYRLATAGLLSLGVSVWTPALWATIGLGVVQLLHVAVCEKSLRALSVQVRIASLLMLLAGLWEPLRFALWIQHHGTWAAVLFGYCYLSRLLLLMPWNCSERLTGDVIEKALLAPLSRQGLATVSREARATGGHVAQWTTS